MVHTSPCAMTETAQSDCYFIKDIILKLCKNKLITGNKATISMEYRNREVLLSIEKDGKEVKGTIPFEILYFDIKKLHLNADHYESAIASLICEEAERILAA